VSAPPAPPLLLASTSPQRRAILTQLGIPFDVVAPRYVEHDPSEVDATALVCEHARGKAESVAGEARERPVLGIDTTVVLGGRAYGKPADAGDAERMLEELSGRTHAVVSGLCLIAPGWEAVEAAATLVTVRALTPRDIAPVRRVRRVGGACRRVCDPGAWRRARRAGRRRLSERRRPARGAARAAARGALPRRVRFRLALRGHAR